MRKRKTLSEHPALQTPSGLGPFFLFCSSTPFANENSGSGNCCRILSADQSSNLKENEVLADDLISLVAQAEPRGFADLSFWVSGTTCVCVCYRVK